MSGGARALARVVVVLGAAALALHLFRANPRDVTLVYGVPADARALEVVVEKADGQVLRRAEFKIRPGSPVSHEVRLQDGAYVLRITLEAERGRRTLERRIDVAESGTIVVPLGG